MYVEEKKLNLFETKIIMKIFRLKSYMNRE